MGFFSDKCAFCGGKATILTRNKLGDGSFICGDCRTKVSHLVSSSDFEKMTKSDVQELFGTTERNIAERSGAFTPTMTFYAGASRNKIVMEADENHGWFRVKDEKVVFDLSDIATFKMNLRTSELSEKEKEEQKNNNNSFMTWLFSNDGYNNYPEVPRCPTGRKVTGLDFVLTMNPNNLHVSKITLNLMPDWSSTKEAGQSAYDCAHNLYQFIQNRAANNYQHNNTATSTTNASASTSTGSSADAYEELKKLKELLDMGIISQEEFDAKKKAILNL